MVWELRRKGVYITPEGLRNLDTYGYHGRDDSFFGNLILKHWWNWCVEIVPLWFAPNLLTLLGLVCNLVAYMLVAIYAPHLTESVPRWACVIIAVLIFLYQTLDNVDGKQARRTGSSSPLGELFDHGCDSITMGLLGIITGATVRMGGILTLIGLVVGWGPFYLAHWEEYHTGILIMGKFNGPTEAQLIVIAILLVTAIAGSGIWVHDLFYIGHTAIRLNYICFAFSVIFSIITVAQNFHKVLSLASRNMPTKEALMQLLPFSCLVVLSLVWLGTEHAMLVAQPHVPLMTISLIFAYLTSRLIVNRVCKEATQPFHAILVPLFIATMLGVIGAIRGAHKGSLAIAIVVLVLSALQFVFFSISIINQLTSYLGIHAFTIVPVDPSTISTQPPPASSTTVHSPLLEQTISQSDDVEININSNENDAGTHTIE